MNVGIVVYSLTGNTFSVAEKLRSTFVSAGHTVTFLTIKAENEDPNSSSPITLTQAPSLKGLDALILGGPVRGFAAAPIMKAYLEQCPDLNGLPVYLFVTHHFPFAFLGGNTAIKMTQKLIEAKHAHVIGTEVVNWSSKHRSDNITSVCTGALSALEGLS